MTALPQLLRTSGEFCVMRTDIIDKLLKCSDGDGALLYLYALRQGKNFQEKQAARDLGFSPERYERAIFTLTSLELSQEAPAAQNTTSAPTAPVYRTAELRQARQGDHRFAAVCDAAESVLGRTLTESLIRSLFSAYDFLGLPAEVIIELLSYLKREKETIRRSDIDREASLWADMGLFSAQAAAEYLTKHEAEKPLLAAMKTTLGLPESRPLSAVESRALSEYIARGFPPDSVSLAAQRMQQSLGKFSWKYLSRILESWDQKGVHTVSEITAIEPERRTNSTSSAPQLSNKPLPPTAKPTTPANLSDWEKQWLEDREARRRRREEER